MDYNFKDPDTNDLYRIHHCTSSYKNGRIRYYDGKTGQELLGDCGATLIPIIVNTTVPLLAIKTGDGSKV